MIQQQDKFLSFLRKVSKGIKESKEPIDKKKAEMRKKLQEVDW